jgi:2-hydroxychromene-2-carboxylate isomerase
LLGETDVSNILAILYHREQSEEGHRSNLEVEEASGIFTVPSMVAEDGLYFGNERLEFLEEAFAKWLRKRRFV